MVRKAFKMKVFPDKTEEYIKRHTPIWKELEVVLKAHGVSNYNIFLEEETSFLFAFAEVASEEKWSEIANTDVCKKWWKYMSDLMETNDDNSPVSIELKQVFYLP
ncbi:L-rhamnose mutarotase [Flavivirga amylovorans]|uniref:L-rhamnose mutarotase n=1 Tax=Flavivirga amylovorans TaxID=870486 RepID=A0ABT8X3M8_9FLAO|nr:L-rhamnose mutarotase [Flavivirga amylovorans]MDO5988520.1 L-rhamnose mutarotase [Flavivirga amylovorans]